VREEQFDLDTFIARRLGLPVAADEADVGLLMQYGLSEAAARHSVRGVASGMYGSLDEAAMWASMGNRGSGRVDVSGLREAVRRRGGSTMVQERRSATQLRPRVIESGRATAAEGKLSLCLIDAGQGASGYYPASTLQEAARAKVFHRRLQCFMDHPSYSEAMDRPERSVRDLVGALTTDAVYRDGGLYAEAKVFASFTEFITERADAIGMSIRAQAVVEQGEVEGHTSVIVREITRAESVDFVTQAGRGGRVVSFT
jgi:hypothetical protein